MNPEPTLPFSRTYSDLFERSMIGHHTNVYFGGTEDQWHVTDDVRHLSNHITQARADRG